MRFFFISSISYANYWYNLSYFSMIKPTPFPTMQVECRFFMFMSKQYCFLVKTMKLKIFSDELLFSQPMIGCFDGGMYLGVKKVSTFFISKMKNQIEILERWIIRSNRSRKNEICKESTNLKWFSDSGEFNGRINNIYSNLETVTVRGDDKECRPGTSSREKSIFSRKYWLKRFWTDIEEKQVNWVKRLVLSQQSDSLKNWNIQKIK